MPKRAVAGFPSAKARRGRQMPRRGVVLVIFALLLVVLLGIVGLVVDGAYLTTMSRQAQNGADAAATAAAYDLLRGRTLADATSTANTFVLTHHGLSNAVVSVSSPPSAGPYAGLPNYIEVKVRVPVRTFLVHVLGVARDQEVRVRAVGGIEAISFGQGIGVLNPDARPGLDVSGGGVIRVEGRVVVNSEGGGVDENGNPIRNGSNGFAARGGQPNSGSGIFANDIGVVGGVDNPENFKPFDPADPSPLRTGQNPEPDSLANMPTPTSATGIDTTRRGAITVNNNSVQGISDDEGKLNFIAQGGEVVANGMYTVAAGDVILHPGIYDSIKVSGGRVFFLPGIYVISPRQNVTNALSFIGGVSIGERVLFYNTTASFNPATGQPDASDAGDNTKLSAGEYAGGVAINATVRFSPINTEKVNYPSMYFGARPVSSDFNGMLFFQRRRHQAEVSIAGNSQDAVLAGTLYAKWSNFAISGQGKYDAQIIAGSFTVTGTGQVTIFGGGEVLGKANQVFLVE